MSMHASCSCVRVRAMNCGREQEEEEVAAAMSDNGLDWLEDPISFLTADVDIGGWWSTCSATPPAAQQDDIGSVVAQTLSPPAPPPPADPSSSSSSNKKRKPASGQKHERPTKKGGKGGGSSSERDMRWAEQLLNPCAAALDAGNLSRVQHLFYVLGELASFSGDPNHRLAAHGLRALALRVGPAVRVPLPLPPCPSPPCSPFACADPRVFRAAVIRFHEVSPWFALPNALANAAILAHGHHHRRPLHVVDLGVSHGVQWPTLLESLTRLPGGGPSVRITVAGPTATSPAPFASAPPGYDFSPHLLRYAASIDLRLAIDRAASLESVSVRRGEALVVCLQFRLGHAAAQERAEVLRKVRALNPELVVLSELDAAGGDGGAEGAFAARLGTLWRFLESTAAAFKGRDGDERRLMEAEAGASLAGEAAGDGREAWRGRMATAGFQEQAFGDDAVESARSLLRKYDGGWEMAAAGTVLALRWKAQPVSFCSLWRPAQHCS